MQPRKEGRSRFVDQYRTLSSQILFVVEGIFFSIANASCAMPMALSSCAIRKRARPTVSIREAWTKKPMASQWHHAWVQPGMASILLRDGGQGGEATMAMKATRGKEARRARTHLLYLHQSSPIFINLHHFVLVPYSGSEPAQLHLPAPCTRWSRAWQLSEPPQHGLPSHTARRACERLQPQNLMTILWNLPYFSALTT